MSRAAVVVDGVWKKFRRGERHDSLRDIIWSTAFRLVRRQSGEPLADEEFWALEDVSFEVLPGQALGVIGPNGAGKSTLLKTLTRILRPTRGQCSVKGRVAALIELAAGFHHDLTGLENIYLQGAILGMKRAEIRKRLDAIIDFAGVKDFIDSPVKRYSSGMQARLGFAIAAHIDPDVMLIDEVLSVGDTAFQQKCERRMEEFRNQGVAIIFVSHNLNAVLQLCDRALLLNRGRVRTLGRTPDVVAAYSMSDGVSGRGATMSANGASLAVRVHTEGADNSEAIMTLPPGGRVSLEVEVRFETSVERAILFIVVWDMTRNFYVYGAQSDSIGIPPIRANEGDQFAFEFSFIANLTRGVYAIEVTLFDPDRHRSNLMVVLRPVAQFRVVEDVSHHGLANLYLSGSKRCTATPCESELLTK